MNEQLINRFITTLYRTVGSKLAEEFMQKALESINRKPEGFAAKIRTALKFL